MSEFYPPEPNYSHELLRPEADFVHRELRKFEAAFDNMDGMPPHESKQELKNMAESLDRFEFLTRPDARIAFAGSIVGGMIGAQVSMKKYYHEKARPALDHVEQQDPGLMQLLDHKLEHALSSDPYYQPGTQEKYQLQDSFIGYVDSVRMQAKGFESDSSRSKSQVDLFLLGLQFGASRPKYRNRFTEELARRLA